MDLLCPTLSVQAFTAGSWMFVEEVEEDGENLRGAGIGGIIAFFGVLTSMKHQKQKVMSTVTQSQFKIKYTKITEFP